MCHLSPCKGPTKVRSAIIALNNNYYCNLLRADNGKELNSGINCSFRVVVGVGGAYEYRNNIACISQTHR